MECEWTKASISGPGATSFCSASRSRVRWPGKGMERERVELHSADGFMPACSFRSACGRGCAAQRAPLSRFLSVRPTAPALLYPLPTQPPILPSHSSRRKPVSMRKDLPRIDEA